MSYIPYEGYEYFVDSDNFYHFNVIVPYSTYNYRVEVISPVLPLITNEIVPPKVSLADFKMFIKSAEFAIEDENSPLYVFFVLFNELGRNRINYYFCGSTNEYKRAMCYYIAHNIEMHLKTMTTEDGITFTPKSNPNIANDKDDKKEGKYIDDVYGTYDKTIFGGLFWAVYGTLAKFDIGYYPH